MQIKKQRGFRFLTAISLLLLLFLLAGQTVSLIDYDFTVSMGLQESVEEVTLLGIAWLKAFALADTVAYIPLLLAGIIGLWDGKKWGFYAMFASLAISVYWPIVNLAAIYLAGEEIALQADKYVSFSIILPLVSFYGLWGMWYLYNHRNGVNGNRS